MGKLMDTLVHRIARLPFVNRSVFLRQFVKFSLVGVTNTAWDFFLFFGLKNGWFGFRLHYLLANSIAFLVSVTNSYILNKRWTFRHTDPRHALLFSRFLTVNLVTLALYEGLLYVLVDHLHLAMLGAKILAVVVVTLWNFFMNKYWTFRKNPTETPFVQKQ